MNALLLFIVGIIYLIIGLNYYLDNHLGMSIVFIAYAVANYGLYLAGR